MVRERERERERETQGCLAARKDLEYFLRILINREIIEAT